MWLPDALAAAARAAALAAAFVVTVAAIVIDVLPDAMVWQSLPWLLLPQVAAVTVSVDVAGVAMFQQ